MSYLRVDINEETELISVGAPLVNPTYPLFFDLGSETIKVVDHADTTEWQIERGIADTEAVAHGKGTALIVNASPYGGAGGTAAFVEPTTATPEQIVDALIAAGLMDAS